MTIWFSTHHYHRHQKSHNRKYFSLVGATTTATILMLSMFGFAKGFSYYSNGSHIHLAAFESCIRYSNTARSITTRLAGCKIKTVSPLLSARPWHKPTGGSALGLMPSRLLQRNRFGPILSRATLCSTKDSDVDGAKNASGTTSLDGEQLLLYQQFKDISLEIRKHDELYYSGEGILSDDEFDALVRKEEELEAQYPDLLEAWQLESGLGTASTRSGRVGTSTQPSERTRRTATTTRAKRQHLTPMLSLDNVFNEEELMTWLKRVVKAATKEKDDDEQTKDQELPSVVTILTEPKLDGVSLCLRYESSPGPSEAATATTPTRALNLRWASTRGDGTIGQDVTAAAKQIAGIPSTIQLSSALDTVYGESIHSHSGIALEVRGEVVLPRSEFLRLKQAEAAAKQKELEEKEQEETGPTATNSKDASHSNGDSAEAPSNATTTTASGATIVSFSNPRNAASGILLRKESDDPEEQSSSKELRSLLRFYAYDLSGLVELSGDDAPNPQQQQQTQRELDGLQLRAQLADWNFPLALPVVVTEIDYQTALSSIGDTTKNEIEVSWDEWFQETILAQNQIRPIMDYFSALETYRERLQEENENLLLLAPGTGTNHRPNDDDPEDCNYDWGDFDVDGCVHKVTHASLRTAMGYSAKSPKWATAHKFPAQSSVARLLDIVVQVGRTGALTPVAILEPTEVGGVTIQRATLHNFGHVQEILGGATNSSNSSEDQPTEVSSRIPKYEPVLVQRAGDVIPQVVRRIRSSSESSSLAINDDDDCWISLDVPKKCPSCESPVAYETISSNPNSVGQVLRCCGPPLLCPPRAITSLKHAFSRDALDVTGLSEARIQQMKDADLLQFPSDIFRMEDDQWERLRELPGWGEKSCQNLREVSETISSKGITLGRFIYSLGIRHLGKHTSELVASCYGSAGAFLEALDEASSYTHTEPNASASNDDQGEDDTNDPLLLHPFPQLEDKLGIGPVAVDSLLAFAKSKELTDATKALAESLTILEQDVVLDEDSSDTSLSEAATQMPWKGFRVVFTGSLGDGLTRSNAQDIAKQLGAKATPGSVSKSTDLVVFGDKGGKKLTQARGLGVATMEASDFINLAREYGFLSDDNGDDG